jgi:hypothetical protein
MTSESRSATYDRRIPLNASLGWTLLLPFQWFIEGTRTELVLSCLWLACLAIPLGYWAFFLNPSSADRIRGLRAAFFLAGVAIMCGGLILVPIAFGVSPAPLRDWLATLAGLLAGSGRGALSAKLIGNEELPATSER